MCVCVCVIYFFSSVSDREIWYNLYPLKRVLRRRGVAMKNCAAVRTILRWRDTRARVEGARAHFSDRQTVTWTIANPLLPGEITGRGFLAQEASRSLPVCDVCFCRSRTPLNAYGGIIIVPARFSDTRLCTRVHFHIKYYINIHVYNIILFTSIIVRVNGRT